MMVKTSINCYCSQKQFCLQKLNFLPICRSMSAASSGVARGITPGSLKLVRNNVAITNINSAPPTAGMAGVTCSARYGQLK